MSAHTEHLEHTESPADMKAQIWKTFWILLAFTLVDIALYFIIPASMMRNWVFIGLGIVKAFFIVSIFMHMKFERKFLRMMIILPMKQGSISLILPIIIWPTSSVNHNVKRLC